MLPVVCCGGYGYIADVMWCGIVVWYGGAGVAGLLVWWCWCGVVWWYLCGWGTGMSVWCGVTWRGVVYWYVGSVVWWYGVMVLV